MADPRPRRHHRPAGGSCRHLRPDGGGRRPGQLGQPAGRARWRRSDRRGRAGPHRGGGDTVGVQRPQHRRHPGEQRCGAVGHRVRVLGPDSRGRQPPQGGYLRAGYRDRPRRDRRPSHSGAASRCVPGDGGRRTPPPRGPGRSGPGHPQLLGRGLHGCPHERGRDIPLPARGSRAIGMGGASLPGHVRVLRRRHPVGDAATAGDRNGATAGDVRLVHCYDTRLLGVRRARNGLSGRGRGRNG